MGKSILEEAVDDVQALKRAAEENAKNLLVEAMSPKIKDFIQSHLGQEGVDAALALDAEPVIGQNDMETMPGQVDNDSMYEIDSAADVECGDEEDDEDEDDEDSEDGDNDVDINIKKEAADEMDEAADDEKETDESVEITSEELKKAFAEVLQSGLKEDAAAKFADPQDPNDGEYGLAHKVKGEVQWADGAKVLNKSKNAKMVTKEQHEKAVQKLQRQLAQYQEAFKYLKKNLNEMNLFNAKLIYTTRLLQNNLSNKQKLSVVESIDKATNKQEVELVYKTLSESLKIAGILSESRTSNIKGPKASRFTKPGSTLTEGKTQEATQTDRWAELAGLTE